jgi:hypothetical protein
VAEEPAHQRLFTLAEANAAIPRLAERVERLRALRDDLRRARELLDILWQRLEAGESVLSTIGERAKVVDAYQAEFAQLVADIHADGIVLRDLDPGIADFPAQVRGVPVYLCWRTGERRITFWHGVKDGFAGRKPIESIEGGSPQVN